MYEDEDEEAERPGMCVECLVKVATCPVFGARTHCNGCFFMRSATGKTRQQRQAARKKSWGF